MSAAQQEVPGVALLHLWIVRVLGILLWRGLWIGMVFRTRIIIHKRTACI